MVVLMILLCRRVRYRSFNDFQKLDDVDEYVYGAGPVSVNTRDSSVVSGLYRVVFCLLGISDQSRWLITEQ